MNPTIEGQSEILQQWRGKTLLVLGGAGTGKSRLSLALAEQLAAERGKVALISADVGQPAFGVPTCFAMAIEPPWNRPLAQWFVGGISPQGNFLPAVVGTARLAERACVEGAQAVVIDTCGMMEGTASRIYRYHQAIASHADGVVAIERDRELAEMIDVLGGAIGPVWRIRPATDAKDRSATERRAWRQSRYEAHFRGGRVFRLDPSVFVDLDWVTGIGEGREQRAAGRLAGLLDRDGFCLGLGIMEPVSGDQVPIYTAVSNLGNVVHLQLGKLCLDRQAGFEETRTS